MKQYNKRGASVSETFELHITGAKRIHEAAKKLGIKTIEIELLNQKGEALATEHMTSHVFKSENLEEARYETLAIFQNLASCNLTRVKLECPYYPHYVKESKYLEAHWTDKEKYFGPMSRNVKSNKVLFTNRIFDKTKFGDFVEKYKDVEVELCLFDTNINQDNKWFAQWGVSNS